MNLLFETKDYQEFLTELSSFISVDSRILDNLIKLKLINIIFNNPKYIQVSNNLFSFTNLLSLKQNYKNIPAYIFATYPLHNTDYNILHFNPENNIFHEHLLINYKSEKTTILYFKEHSNSVDIYTKLNFRRFTDINIDLLSKNDNELFQNYIISELRNEIPYYLIYIIHLKHQKSFFLKETSIELKYLDITKFDLCIQESKDTHQQLITDIKNFKKQEIDKLLYSLILRKEMHNF